MQPYDMPIDRLREYRPPLSVSEEKLQPFWAKGLKTVDELPWNDELQREDYPVRRVRLFSVSLDGVDGAPLRGWYAYPDTPGSKPGLVIYRGYNGSYENGVHEVVNWALHGYATVVMAVRGQQGSGTATPSHHGHVAGWMTQNILDPQSYYFRGVYLDAVRVLHWAKTLPEIDATRVGIIGMSQGGGITLAVAALSGEATVAVAECPFLCHFQRAVDIAPSGPYGEINEFLRQNGDPAVEKAVWETLGLYDAMNLAPRIRMPILVSSGLIDQLTPPSTIYAAYNHMASETKKIHTYRYFGHEFVPRFQTEKLAWLLEHLNP